MLMIPNIFKQKKYRNFAAQFLSNLAILTLSFLYGCKVGFTQSNTSLLEKTVNGTKNYDEAPFEVSQLESTLIVSISYTSTIISVVISLICGSMVGRKIFISMSALAYLIIWIMIYLTSSGMAIVVGFFFYGISASMHVVIGLIYFGEISSPKNRGIFGILYGLFMNIGRLVQFEVGRVFDYRTSILFPIIVSFLALAMVLFLMVESPYYLIANGKDEKALKSLRWLNGAQNLDKEVLTNANIKKYVFEQSEMKNKRNFKELLSADNIKLVLIMSLINVASVCNIESLMSFGDFVVQPLASNPNLSDKFDLFVSVFNMVDLVSGVLCLYTIKMMDRRTLLTYGFLLLSVLQLLVAFLYYVVNTQGNSSDAIGYAIFIVHYVEGLVFSLTILPGSTVLRSEVFPHNMKEFYNALMSFINDMANFSVTYTFHQYGLTLGYYTLFAIYGILGLITALIVFLYVVNTKDKTLHDIRVIIIEEDEVVDAPIELPQGMETVHKKQCKFDF